MYYKTNCVKPVLFKSTIMAENITTDAIFIISDEDVADTDVETAAPAKKKKHLQKLKESYAQEYAWVTKSKKGQFHAHCTVHTALEI